MLDEEECKQLREFLLCQVSPSGKRRRIKSPVQFGYNQKTITTTWRYSDDPDMSDISLEFYKIVYSDVLSTNNISNLLNDNGGVVNRGFVGDTMNSLNTVNKVVESVSARSYEQDVICLSKLMTEYSAKYHSLANFWLLPMGLGRTIISTEGLISVNLNKYSSSKDYMFPYLKLLKENFQMLQFEAFPYFHSFKSFDDFKQRHFIEVNKIQDTIINNSEDIKINDLEEAVKGLICNINKRAELIVKDETVAKNLYRRFFIDSKTS